MDSFLNTNGGGGGGTSDNNCLCLICGSSISSRNDNYPNDTDNLIFNQIKVIFILKHLLHLPTSQLENYLKAYGSPDQWLNLCDKCSQLTDTAGELHLQLLKIEKQLKGVQRKILDTIKSDDQTSQPNDLQGKLNAKWVIYRETRCFVKNESYQNLYLYVKEEPYSDGLEPERSPIPTPSTPDDDQDHDSSVSCQVKEEIDRNSDSDDNEDNYIPNLSSPSPPQSPSSPASKKDNLLTCDICGKKAFSSKGSLSTHRVRVHKVWKIGPLKSRHKKTTSSPSLAPKKNNLLTCDICGKTAYSSNAALSCHRVRVHKVWKRGPHKTKEDTAYCIDNPEQTSTTNSSRPRRFPCPSCNLVFRHGTKWQSHIQNVHKSEQLSCFMENCNRKFYILKLFLSHLTVHLTGEDFICSQCPPPGKVFPDRGTLNFHIKKKHSPDGYQPPPPPKPDISQLTCQICGSKFSSKQSLAAHRLRVHKVWKRGPKRKYGRDEGQKHLCDLCGSSFKSNGRLQYHIKLSHLNCYPVHCHLCGKGVTSQRELKLHLVRCHKEEAEKEGLEMFTCRIEGCTRYYLSKEAFDKHFMEYHGDKDKPFKCGECDKSFFWRGRLKEHQITHRNKGLKCFQCKFCDRGYPVLTYLKSHLREKHGVKCKRGEEIEFKTVQ